MHGIPIEPLDDGVTLAAVLRAVPPGEACGVWIDRPARGAGRLPGIGGISAGSGIMLVVHGDLGALLHRVSAVVVRFQGEITAVPSTVLALIRMLELLSVPGAPPELHALGPETAEEILASRRAEGRTVNRSRVIYRFPSPAAVDAPAAPALG